jgi:hypothetical protein
VVGVVVVVVVLVVVVGRGLVLEEMGAEVD